MARLLYATPTGKHPHVAYAQCMRAMELGCKSFVRGAEDFMFACGPVHMARSKIAERTVSDKDPYDFVLMHDDDLMVDPLSPLGNPIDVWHELFAKNPKVGVIGAVYMREQPLIPNVVTPHPDYPEEMCHVISGMPAQPFECGGLGTGFMMVRAETIRAIYDMEEPQGAPPIFRFALSTNRFGMTTETGEDYDFCRRVRQVGYSVLADPRFHTVHMKDSGALHFDHGKWEAAWSEENPDLKAHVEDLRSHCPPAMKLAETNGFLVLDHVACRELDAKAWRERQAERHKQSQAA